MGPAARRCPPARSRRPDHRPPARRARTAVRTAAGVGPSERTSARRPRGGQDAAGRQPTWHLYPNPARAGAQRRGSHAQHRRRNRRTGGDRAARPRRRGSRAAPGAARARGATARRHRTQRATEDHAHRRADPPHLAALARGRRVSRAGDRRDAGVEHPELGRRWEQSDRARKPGARLKVSEPATAVAGRGRRVYVTCAR